MAVVLDVILPGTSGTSEGIYVSQYAIFGSLEVENSLKKLSPGESVRIRGFADWNLPGLKTEKDEHYADILTTLYKQQMRIVWEESKADRRRASKLAIEGGEANAQRQKVQKQGHNIGAIRTQETEQLSSAPESCDGRS